MQFPNAWYVISGIAFCFGILALLVSGFVLGSIMMRLFPLLTDTHQQVQDLGDLAANTVGRAEEAMELVELRVSQTMGQATQGSKSVAHQALGLGSTLAGGYMVVRFIQAFRSQWSSMHAKRRGGWRRKK